MKLTEAGMPPAPPPRPVLRARLDDVAREAGVSLATVDRALNRRPGVSTRTLQRVQEAVSLLAMRSDAATAAQPRERCWLLCFLLPTGAGPFVAQVREALQALAPWLAAQQARVDVRTTDAGAPAAAAAAVRRLRGQYDAVVLMLADAPAVRDAVARMAGDGTCVVTLASDIAAAARQHFVGIDHQAAGRTAAALLSRSLAGRAGQIGVLLGSPALLGQAQRLAGFQERMAPEQDRLELLAPRVSGGRPELARALLAQLRAEQPALVGLYSIEAGDDGLHGALQGSGLAWVCHELTPHTRAALQDGTASAVIGQSAAQQTQLACRWALARLARQPPPADATPPRIEIYLKDNLP
ncbi:LacI family DNA-binding transcriptional regulator [Roseateles sp. LKC17W]|uniref:LacI family DNA-binding transcriptional regulator n=1 Tax=Pelomonas margarita TaxID=3299031 RepID=A0ABW7FGA5_9BURK